MIIVWVICCETLLKYPIVLSKIQKAWTPVQNILYSLMESIGGKSLCNFQLILHDFQEEWVLMKKGASFVVLLLDNC